MKWIQILTAFKLYCNLLMCQNITIFVVIWLCFLSLNFCWGGAKTSPIFNIWYRISHGIHELHVWTDIWNLKPICLILFKLFEIDAFIFGRISTGHAQPYWYIYAIYLQKFVIFSSFKEFIQRNLYFLVENNFPTLSNYLWIFHILYIGKRSQLINDGLYFD